MLSGLKVLITGASSGIGKATAAVMTGHGAIVYGVGRNQQSLEEMLSENILAGFICADLTAENECSRVVASAVECMSGLTTVVNSAGVLQGGGMDVATLDNFKFNFGANVQTAFEIMQHAIPHLKACGKEASPSIINISSVNGKQAFRGCATYCASKAALDQLSRCASLDLAPFNIRVNVVNPGVVETPLQRRGGMTGTKPLAINLLSLTCINIRRSVYGVFGSLHSRDTSLRTGSKPSCSTRRSRRVDFFPGVQKCGLYYRRVHRNRRRKTEPWRSLILLSGSFLHIFEKTD